MIKKKNKIKVLVGGCFDLLHFGHYTFLTIAAAYGDKLIIALEPDEFIKIKKNKKPVHTQVQRAKILKALRFVDKVIMLPFLKTDEDYYNLVDKIKPDIIAVTEGDPNIDKKRDQAKKIGAKLKIVTPNIPGFSTNEIISRD